MRSAIGAPAHSARICATVRTPRVRTRMRVHERLLGSRATSSRTPQPRTAQCSVCSTPRRLPPCARASAAPTDRRTPHGVLERAQSLHCHLCARAFGARRRRRHHRRRRSGSSTRANVPPGAGSTGLRPSTKPTRDSTPSPPPTPAPASASDTTNPHSAAQSRTQATPAPASLRFKIGGLCDSRARVTPDRRKQTPGRTRLEALVRQRPRHHVVRVRRRRRLHRAPLRVDALRNLTRLLCAAPPARARASARKRTHTHNQEPPRPHLERANLSSEQNATRAVSAYGQHVATTTLWRAREQAAHRVTRPQRTSAAGAGEGVPGSARSSGSATP